MKYQTFFMMCIIAVLTFGCEVSHPVDPAYDNCRQAGGTWQNSKCLCPNEIATSQHQSVCKNDKLYTCSNGVYDFPVDCPGTCHVSGFFCDNTEGLNGDICKDGILFSCSEGNCKLKLVCPKGCDDENNSKNCALECGVGSGITDTQKCDGMYLKTCNDGFWDMGRYCYNGCDNATNKCKQECNGNETKCEENRLRKCVDGFWNDMYCKECASESECKKESCSYNALKCSKDSIVMQCDEYGEWQTKTQKTQKICLSNILYSCDGKNEDELPDAKSCDCLDESTKCNPVPDDVCQNKTDICKDNILYICNNSPVTQISCPWGCDSDGKCNCDEDDNKCNGNILSTCENGNVIETYCAYGCENGACNTTGSEPIKTCDESIDTIKCEGNSIRYYCKNGKWQEHRIDNSPLCIFNDNLSKFISYRCENDEFIETICPYGCNEITQVCKCNNYSEESVQCDNGKVIKYCEDGDWRGFNTDSSRICMPSNEQNEYKLYECNGNTVEETITCEYGCSYDKDDCNYDSECVSTEPTSTCSFDKILITCNGAGNADVTMCDIGCVMENNKATCVNYDESYNYLEWYAFVQNDEDKLSNLNSLMIDAYMKACENPENLKDFNINFDNIGINEGGGVVLELSKDNRSHYIAISKKLGVCQYRILDLEQDETEETWTSDRVCKIHEGDDKDENLLAKLSDFHQCYDSLDYKACIESNTGNKQDLTDILEEIEIKYTSNSQFTFSETNNFDSCP